MNHFRTSSVWDVLQWVIHIQRYQKSKHSPRLHLATELQSHNRTLIDRSAAIDIGNEQYAWLFTNCNTDMLLLIQTHCKHISRLHYEEGGTLPRAIGSAVPMSRDQDYARAKASLAVRKRCNLISTPAWNCESNKQNQLLRGSFDWGSDFCSTRTVECYLWVVTSRWCSHALSRMYRAGSSVSLWHESCITID